MSRCESLPSFRLAVRDPAAVRTSIREQRNRFEPIRRARKDQSRSFACAALIDEGLRRSLPMAQSRHGAMSDLSPLCVQKADLIIAFRVGCAVGKPVHDWIQLCWRSLGSNCTKVCRTLALKGEKK